MSVVWLLMVVLVGPGHVGETCGPAGNETDFQDVLRSVGSEAFLAATLVECVEAVPPALVATFDAALPAAFAATLLPGCGGAPLVACPPWVWESRCLQSFGDTTKGKDNFDEMLLAMDWAAWAAEGSFEGNMLFECVLLSVVAVASIGRKRVRTAAMWAASLLVRTVVSLMVSEFVRTVMGAELAFALLVASEIVRTVMCAEQAVAMLVVSELVRKVVGSEQAAAMLVASELVRKIVGSEQAVAVLVVSELVRAASGVQTPRLERGEFAGVSGASLCTIVEEDEMEEEEAGGDPWANWIPTEWEIVLVEPHYEPPAFSIQNVAEANNWDPHQLMYFVFEHGPVEGVQACELYYSILQRMDDDEVTYSGGVVAEVPSRSRPGPSKKLRLLVKGLEGRQVREAQVQESLVEWYERIGLGCGDSGRDGYFTTIGGKILDPKVPIGKLGLVDGTEVVYQVRLRGGGYGGNGKGGVRRQQTGGARGVDMHYVLGP